MIETKKKVLVVEDNEAWRKLLVMVIERSGYEVLQACDGLEAVDKATAARPDLILMDVGLPKMTGDAATAVLKANPATRKIPVVIQTAYACNEIALLADAAEILQKPLELAQIHRILAKYLMAQASAGAEPAAGANAGAAA
jgi:two-component system cell cycle response regulator DivK